MRRKCQRSEVAALGGCEVPMETVLRVGTPWREIVAASDELGVTLIVMGSHGKRSLEELLLGSTVERATRHANCPVLVVRSASHPNPSVAPQT